MSKARLSIRKGSKNKEPIQDFSAVSPASTTSTYSPTSPFTPSGSILSSPATIASPLEPGNSPFQWQKPGEDPPPYTAIAGRGTGTSIGNARLQQIADEIEVSLKRNRPLLEQQSAASTYLTDRDTQDALKLLGERRQSDPEYKAPKGLSKLTKSKAKTKEFSDKEISRAFRATVEGNCSLGLIQAFLALGARVDVSRRASTNMWKQITKKDQADQRSDVLQLATRGGNNELIQLLAAHADQRSLDESLLIAVYQQNLLKTQTLLEFGASIYDAHEVFLSAVDNGDAELVELLLVAPKLPCTECRAKALVEAAATSSLRMVSALLFSDADTQYNNAQAMNLAAQNSDLPVSVAIAGSPKPPSPSNLDSAAANCYRDIPDHRICLSILEVCLCGGAYGKQTNQVLIFATERNELDTVELLLRHNVSTDYQGGQALCTAITHEADLTFTAILSSRMNAVTLGNGLVTAIGSSKLGLDFCKRLLEKGASVDYKNAKPIVTAINALQNTILKLFLSKVPSTQSLAVALKAALQLFGRDRMAALSLLLSEGPKQHALDKGLLKLIREEPTDLEAVSALLDAGASADYKDGLSVVDSARRFELPTLKLLDRAVFSKVYVFSEAAAAAVAENTKWVQPEGLAVLQFLLESGASPSALDDALCQAAVLFNLQALQLLAGWIEPGDIYTLAFAQAIEVGEKWHSPSGLDVVRILLEGGAKGDIVDGALLQAEERFINGRAPEALIDTLLEFKADVDFDDGHAIELAVKAGHLALLEKLFSSNPSARTLSMSLSAALISGHPSQKLMKIINALLGKEGEIADPNYVVPGMDPPIFLALQKYPTSNPVVRRMLEIGCRIDTKISFKVFGEIAGPQKEEDDDYGAENRLFRRTNRDDLRDIYDTNKSISARMSNDETGTPAEDVTALAWACCQVGDRAVRAAVFEVLLEFKADSNFTTSYSKSTPLLLASRYERPDLVNLLVEQEINLSMKDKFSRSALFFAAGNGDVRSTMMIIQRKARVNDGSLHEAARELYPDIISLLVKAGHDVNFTSTKHEGLTALGELVMYCNGKGLDSRIEDCIELLVRAKIDPAKKWRGKSVLYMALDNPEPHPVTSALLERLMWKHIQNEANIYNEEDLYYSPTMYLKKGYFLGSESDQRAMIQLLKDHGAEDHYYASEGLRQPQDAVGMPQQIIRSERRRREHEESIERKQQKHEASLRRHWEQAQQQFQVQEAQQQQYIRHQEEQFEQRQYHMISAAYTQARIQYQQDLQRLNMERKSARMQAQLENHKLEVQWKLNRQQAQLNHDRVVTKQRMNNLDSQAQRQKMARSYQIQRQIVQAKGTIAMIQGRPQVHALAAKQQSTRLSMMARHAKNQRLIGY